jgi:hypothetical protein
VSVEGGIRGEQRRIVCIHCGKVFFAWRPDTAPGAKIKCYFCKKEMEDEASKRPAAAAPAPAPSATPATSAPAAPAAPETPPAEPAPG